MHLLAPLISGIANAGNGSAAVYRRGSTVLATLYSSFEGDSYPSSGLDSNDRVILDSYGRAEVYVNDICDVRIYDADGVLEISFTAGFSAAGIEVRSPSFTGSEYDFSAANAPGLPTTLQAVLDLWLGTRAMSDWGLASGAQPFVIVTDDAYGAQGDGVADDTLPVQAAIAAAGNGGSVFFPPGVYRITAPLLLATGAVTLAGGGYSTTRITIDAASGSVLTVSGTATGYTIDGLYITASQTNASTLIDLTGVPVANVTLMRSYVGGTHSSGHNIAHNNGSVVTARDSAFDVRGSASAIYCAVGGIVVLSRCSLNASGAYTGSGIVYDGSIYAQGCFFGTYIQSGTCACIKFNSVSVLGSVTGCVFAINDPVSATATIGMDLGTPDLSSSFSEAGNQFSTFTQYTSPSFTAYVYGFTLGTNILLRSRDTRVLVVVNNAATVTLPLDQYGTVILQTTHAAVVFDGDRGYNGSQGQVFVYHPSGGAGTATPTTKFFGGTAATTANTSTHVWQYVCTMVNATLRFMVVVDARACGNGA